MRRLFRSYLQWLNPALLHCILYFGGCTICVFRFFNNVLVISRFCETNNKSRARHNRTTFTVEKNSYYMRNTCVINSPGSSRKIDVACTAHLDYYCYIRSISSRKTYFLYNNRNTCVYNPPRVLKW